MHNERRVLLLGDAHVVARVVLLHDVPRSRIQQNRLFVELGQLRRSHSNQCDAISGQTEKKLMKDFRFFKLNLTRERKKLFG